MFGDKLGRPLFRPAWNMGLMMDIPTGRYELGKHGESIMNGGLSPVTGFISGPNMFKTALLVFSMSRLRRAVRRAHNAIYDSEGTLNPIARFTMMSKSDPYLRTIDYEHDEQFSFTDLSVMLGDEFFEITKDVLEEKKKNQKKYTITTAFIDVEGKNKEAMIPTAVGVDSFSKLEVKLVKEMYDKNDVGDSALNTDAMTSGRIKNQMFNQIPRIASQTGSYWLLSAHTDTTLIKDKYAPDTRKLADMGRDKVIKGSSNGMYSLPNNVWEIEKRTNCLNKDRMPLYPSTGNDQIKDDTDLVIITVQNVRPKNGISGLPIEIIVSQSSGVKEGLTWFHYCKKHDWGITGNNTTYHLDLLPDVNITRTKIRDLVENNEKLRRAAEIQADLLQLFQFHRELNYPAGLLCTPLELYEDLIKMGYDWDVILTQTRNYHVPVEDEDLHEKKFLSTMDLLRMRSQMYVPYWFTKEQKAAIKLV